VQRVGLVVSNDHVEATAVEASSLLSSYVEGSTYFEGSHTVGVEY
jgi:hypothetical protein